MSQSGLRPLRAPSTIHFSARYCRSLLRGNLELGPSPHNVHALALVVDVHRDQELVVEHVVHVLRLGKPNRVPSPWGPEEFGLGDVPRADLPRLARAEGSVEPTALTGSEAVARRSRGGSEPDEDGLGV